MKLFALVLMLFSVVAFADETRVAETAATVNPSVRAEAQAPAAPATQAATVKKVKHHRHRKPAPKAPKAAAAPATTQEAPATPVQQ